MNHNPSADSRGFTLVEVLISFVVLLFAVLTLTTAYPYAFSRVSERDDELQAVAFGQQYMEQIRQQIHAGATSVTASTTPIDAGYSVAFGSTNYSSASPPPSLVSPGNFTASAVLNPRCAGCTSYDVAVTVSWSVGGSPRKIVLDSIITSEAP